jgi:hypothetical protein
MKEIFGLQFLEETEATEDEMIACAVFGGMLEVGYCRRTYASTSICDDSDTEVVYDGEGEPIV